MISNYSLFYSYKRVGDVLIINVDNELKPTSVENKGDVSIFFNNENIVEIRIDNISKIMKIRNDGIIYLPNKQFIDVINTILKNAGCDTLEYVNESGFVIGEVISINNDVCKINIGHKHVHALLDKDKALNILDKVVVLLQGHRLPDGTLFNKQLIEQEIIDAHICSMKELGIDDSDELLIIDDEAEVGSDFFLSEGDNL